MVVYRYLALRCRFLQGFIDAIVGGGGLIQTPIILLPTLPVATVIGTLKFPLVETSFAAYQYLKKVTMN
jgi:uncharacterized membrane protein YfcA